MGDGTEGVLRRKFIAFVQLHRRVVVDRGECVRHTRAHAVRCTHHVQQTESANQSVAAPLSTDCDTRDRRLFMMVSVCRAVSIWNISGYFFWVRIAVLKQTLDRTESVTQH